MAKSIRISHAVRFLAGEVAEYLALMGIRQWMIMPMNIDVVSSAPESAKDDDEWTETITLYYEGGFKVHGTLSLKRDCYVGIVPRLESLTLRWRVVDQWDRSRSQQRETAFRKWTGLVALLSDDREEYVLEGSVLDALKINASNVRNGLPANEWDDPERPRYQREEDEEPSSPSLSVSLGDALKSKGASLAL